MDSALQSKIPLASKVFVDCSTVHPETSTIVSQLLQQKQASFVAAPVFGASPVAESGKLIFAMAGPQDTIKALEPLVKDVMGRAIINMGTDVQKSSLLKIAG
jgi:3-hydroxyisobutyrate dehydrogenase-like beta-hydroxyacid dehydrogenase